MLFLIMCIVAVCLLSVSVSVMVNQVLCVVLNIILSISCSTDVVSNPLGHKQCSAIIRSQYHTKNLETKVVTPLVGLKGKAKTLTVEIIVLCESHKACHFYLYRNFDDLSSKMNCIESRN